MSESSEEDPRRISHPSFDRFVHDEFMVARAMIKTVHSLSDQQRSRVLKLKEGIINKTSRKTSLNAPNAAPRKRKDHDFGMEGWSQDVPPRDPPVLPFGITNKTAFIGDGMKENNLKSDIEADRDALKNGGVGSKPSMKDNAFQADHEQGDSNRLNGGDINGCKDKEAEDKCPERCNKWSLQVENLSDNSSVDESEESISGKKTLEQHASISLPPLLQPSAFHQKQALPAQSTRAEFADGKKLQASNVSLKQFHWSPSDSHVAHKNVPETAVYCYPREVNGRTSWKILLEDASKLDGYKKMYANKKKRTETEMFSKPDVWKPQEASYLHKRLKALSYGRLDPSRRHSIGNVESKDLVQPTASPSPDHWNFSSTVSLAQRMHGSRKIMEKEFPHVHYDTTKSNSMSNLSEWTKAQLKTSIRQKGCQQRALQYSQLQLNLPSPAEYSTDKAGRKKDTPI